MTWLHAAIATLVEAVIARECHAQLRLGSDQRIEAIHVLPQSVSVTWSTP